MLTFEGPVPRESLVCEWVEPIAGGGEIVGRTVVVQYEEAARWAWGDGMQDQVVDMYGTFLDAGADLFKVAYGRLDRSDQAATRFFDRWIKELEALIATWYDDGLFDYLMEETETDDICSTHGVRRGSKMGCQEDE